MTRSEDTNEANVTSRPPFQFKRNARFPPPGTVAPTAGSACQPGLHRFPFSFSERPKGSISKQPHSTVMDADKRSMDGVATIFPLPQPPTPPRGLGPVKATLTMSSSAEWINPTNLFNGGGGGGGAASQGKGHQTWWMAAHLWFIGWGCGTDYQAPPGCLHFFYCIVLVLIFQAGICPRYYSVNLSDLQKKNG